MGGVIIARQATKISTRLAADTERTTDRLGKP